MATMIDLINIFFITMFSEAVTYPIKYRIIFYLLSATRFTTITSG